MWTKSTYHRPSFGRKRTQISRIPPTIGRTRAGFGGRPPDLPCQSRLKRQTTPKLVHQFGRARFGRIAPSLTQTSADLVKQIPGARRNQLSRNDDILGAITKLCTVCPVRRARVRACARLLRHRSRRSGRTRRSSPPTARSRSRSSTRSTSALGASAARPVVSIEKTSNSGPRARARQDGA